MAAVEALLTDEGQITIPAELRSRLGWKPRDRVIVEVDGNGLKLRVARAAVLASYAAVTPRTRPEDFRDLRERFEQGVADDVMAETE